MSERIRAGAVVAWWSGTTLGFGVVAGEDKQRVRLVVKGGNEERVTHQRIAFEVAPPGPVPDRGLDERRLAGERTAAVGRRARERAREIDVATLWEIAREVPPGGGEAAPLTSGALAELALGSAGGEERAATCIALLEDGLHFVRRIEGWLPRPASAVEELRAQKERVRLREERTRVFFERLAEASQGGAAFVSADDEVERHYLDALTEVAACDDAASEAARTAAQRALAAAGLRFDRPNEGAFRLLRRLGRFASDDQNLQPLRFGLRTAFSAEAEVHASALAARGFERSGRLDLTGLTIISIDGPSTREIDDALSWEPLADGGQLLGVHIADPSALVLPGDPVDTEALTRGLTYYMPDLRLPMMPAPISEQACSLLPGEDRPAVSFLLQLAADGALGEIRLTRSLIRSRARLDYAACDATLARGEGPHLGLLQALAAMGAQRRALRLRSGAVAIFNDEVEVHVETGGRPVLDRLAADSPSRNAVAEAMILAGEAAGRLGRDAGVPLIFRRQAAALLSPEELPTEPVRDPVQVRRILRAMRRAEASLEPAPHASLGLSAYAQVTSPLRRFQDLVSHRQLLAWHAGLPPPYGAEDLQRIVATTEQADWVARRAERAADEYWTLRYLEGQTGQEIEAIVVESEPRAVLQLVETLREQPVNGLGPVTPGERVCLVVERVNPRAGLLVLRPATGAEVVTLREGPGPAS